MNPDIACLLYEHGVDKLDWTVHSEDSVGIEFWNSELTIHRFPDSGFMSYTHVNPWFTRTGNTLSDTFEDLMMCLRASRVPQEGIEDPGPTRKVSVKLKELRELLRPSTSTYVAGRVEELERELVEVGM